MSRNVDIQELSNFLLDFATTLMAVGSHTSRVVRNVTRIADSFDYGVDMTVFQRNITMTIKHRDDYSIRRTYVRRIPAAALNFRTISDLSSLSWDAYDNHLELAEIQKQYSRIITRPPMSRWLVLVLVAFANAAFCRLFGGDLMAMGLVWLATLVGFFVRQELMKRHVNHMVVFVVCAFIASLIAGLGFRYHWGTTEDIALGTSVLFLIPGVPLINSIIDILEGHVLVGWSRAINAFILIICIALGLSMTIVDSGKGSDMNAEFWIAVLLDGVAAAIAAIGFAVISNPPRRAVLIAALLAAIGHACRFYLLQRTPFDLTSSTLFASFTIGMLSMMFAKIIHCPAEVFSFPALLPMIPGMYAYKTILGLIRFMKTDDDSVLQLLIAEIFRNGLTTIFVLFALVIGVSLPLFIFYKQSFMMTRLLHIKKKIG